MDPKYIVTVHIVVTSFCQRGTYEPPRDKTNKVSVPPAKTRISLGICPVWSESSLCAQWVAKDPTFLHADSEDSDQTWRMPRLIWVLAGCICHFVGFVMMQLIYCCNDPMISPMWFDHRVMCPKMQMEWQKMQPLFSQLLRSSLVWVYTVCPELSVQNLSIIMSPPFRVGRHIVFAWVVCPSVCHKIVAALKLKNHLRYFHETLHKCKATWDDLQSARIVTLDSIFLELWPFEIENSRFCDMVVSLCNPKTVQATVMKLHININQH